MEGFWLGALVMASLTVGATLGLVAGVLLAHSGRKQREEEMPLSQSESRAQWEQSCREVMRGIWGGD